MWDADGQRYSPSGLAQLIIREATGKEHAIQGPKYWVDADGATLLELTGLNHGDGAAFADSIEAAPADKQPELARLYGWATSLADEGLADLLTTTGLRRSNLNVRVPGKNVALVSIYNEYGASMTVYRTVFERLAPDTLRRLDHDFPGQIRAGNSLANPVPDPFLALVRDALTEAGDAPAK